MTRMWINTDQLRHPMTPLNLGKDAEIQTQLGFEQVMLFMQIRHQDSSPYI